MKTDPGTSVRSVDNPSREGFVTNTPPRERPSGVFYQIKWVDGQAEFLHPDEFEEATNISLRDTDQLIMDGRYGRTSDLRRNLTYVHLSGRLANLIYAMGITNTEFYSHQYRPLLTLLESPVNGILIADEVGLGKTIEAGLIWTELRARYDFRKLLVVCPAMLREKWRDELMIRFGVDAVMVNADQLFDELSKQQSHMGTGKAWIASYPGIRPPKDWSAGGRFRPTNPGPSWKLADFLSDATEDEPIIDLVIFDEAHYMRNSDSATWRIGDLLVSVSDYQVMLSATPINLRNRDLFNLVRLLDPDHFHTIEDFELLLSSNEPLIAARDLALNTQASKDEIFEKISLAAETPELKNSVQLESLLQEPPTSEMLANKGYRAELANMLERISLLSHVITRTRKKDVQENRVERDVSKKSVKMSPPEEELYRMVTNATRAYAIRKDISSGFLLSGPQRQITSCPAAVIEAWSSGRQSLDELIEDTAIESDSSLEYDFQDDIDIHSSLSALLKTVIPKKVDIDELRNNDTKFSTLTNGLDDFLNDHPEEKVIIFTTFRATASYLEKRLNERGFKSIKLWGNPNQSKQETIDQFQNDRSLRILISTEVASEGVDLQFCKVLVNYDLPWNPTRIEQRIGRIDRLGQKSKIIHIWNLWFENTIDQRILTRLLDRLQIFKTALGESEAVVGEEIQRLESALLCRDLTADEEEKIIDRSAQALENLRIQREQLEKDAPHMMAHGQRVLERIAAANELSRRVTERDLIIYVKDYLTKFWPGHRFAQETGDTEIFGIQLPSELASRLDDYLKKEKLQGKTLLASGQNCKCRFLNKISEQPKKSTEIIHQLHPLIRFIGRDLKERNEHFYPVVSIQICNNQHNIAIKDGIYVFTIKSWIFEGIREEEVLVYSVCNLDSGIFLDDDLAESLIQLARLNGKDWLEGPSCADSNLVIKRMDEESDRLDTRYQEEKRRKFLENQDRARFQIESIDRFLNRRIDKLEDIRLKHLYWDRTSLAKATQGKIDKLLNNMDVKKAKIKEQESVRSEKNSVCSGLIRVTI